MVAVVLLDLVFTTRHHASVVLAVILCLYVRLSPFVHHTLVLCENG